jgi:integrase
MILIAYRHGLRASELCDLQWHQVELNTGQLHVRRAKRGTPSVHRRIISGRISTWNCSPGACSEIAA